MSQGYQAALGIDTASPVTRGYEFESCAITKEGTIIDTSGIRGTRSHLASRTRMGNYTVSGTIELMPVADDLTRLLPWILGAAASGNTYALAETLSERYVAVDKVAKVFSYAGCYINRATFSGSAGEPIRLRLDILGKTESIAAAGTFPTVNYASGAPYLFSDSTLALVGAEREVQQWSLVIDNQLESYFYNSTTATRILPRDRMVTFTCTNPFTSSETDLYDQALEGTAATLTLAGPSGSLAFSFATLQVPARGPTIPGRREVPLELEGTARRVGSTSELVVTLS